MLGAGLSPGRPRTLRRIAPLSPSLCTSPRTAAHTPEPREETTHDRVRPDARGRPAAAVDP